MSPGGLPRFVDMGAVKMLSAWVGLPGLRFALASILFGAGVSASGRLSRLAGAFDLLALLRSAGLFDWWRVSALGQRFHGQEKRGFSASFSAIACHLSLSASACSLARSAASALAVSPAVSLASLARRSALSSVCAVCAWECTLCRALPAAVVSSKLVQRLFARLLSR